MQANQFNLENMIKTLWAISEDCEAGVQRQSYSPAYRQGVNYIREKMEEAGLEVYEDTVGNVFGLLPGDGSEAAAIYSGSHLDTVRCAGGYDGIAGVVSAIEVARMIRESGQPLHHPYVAFGTVGEEGTRFGQVLMGSQFMAGVFGKEQLDSLKGIEDGKTLRQAMEEYGLPADDRVEESSLLGKKIHSFVELHGEQGPVLEETETEIGIVDAIAGIAWLEVVVSGQANHSGTVPMNMRKDAGIVAYRMILAINDYITDQYCGQATMTAGQLKLEPGSSNCIPGKCVFTLDIRSGKKEILGNILQQVEVYASQAEEKDGIQVDIHIFSNRDPVPMNVPIQEKIKKSCEKRAYSYRSMNSGAGHDAMIFAKEWPTAMIFLPNKDGISHNPAEYISPEDLKRGAEVLYDTIRSLDQE